MGGRLLIVLFGVLSGCADPASEARDPASVSAERVRLDQVAWLRALQARRPDLLGAPASGTVADPAWQALVVRPRYRERILTGDVASYEALVAAEYTRALRAGDAAWAERLRAGHAAFLPRGNVAIGYPPGAAYVGLRVGAPTWDDTGYTPKILVELRDPVATLAWERFVAFADALASRGFVGAAKIDLRPGQVRFQYNNVIVHAETIDQARTAESVAVAFFGAELEHVSRGVDPPVPPGGRGEDWHHALLHGAYEGLPPDVRRFVDGDSPP